VKSVTSNSFVLFSKYTSSYKSHYDQRFLTQSTPLHNKPLAKTIPTIQPTGNLNFSRGQNFERQNVETTNIESKNVEMIYLADKDASVSVRVTVVSFDIFLFDILTSAILPFNIFTFGISRFHRFSSTLLLSPFLFRPKFRESYPPPELEARTGLILVPSIRNTKR
jgi:hypothetical protein